MNVLRNKDIDEDFPIEISFDEDSSIFISEKNAEELYIKLGKILGIELSNDLLCSIQSKLAESVDKYFDYVSHAQDIHPYSKEKEQELYNNMCWRWQDWDSVKYDHPSIWDLNFDDYVDNKRQV